ncbi:hypothetical protein BC834DRAFT_372776 [Gloeopeniophorella convolvens]|nr:hypothetical protein BC834DRAFT_372776 [Gloeopeniophorella convolvens]
MSTHSQENVHAPRYESGRNGTLDRPTASSEWPIAGADLIIDATLPGLSFIALVDDKIHLALLQLSAFKSHRNALLAISKLPTELLWRIFQFHALECSPGSDDDRLGWVAVAHVCQRWRRTELRSQTLNYDYGSV